MTRLTEKHKETILKLFAGGSTIANLAQSYGVTVERIEGIIREAMGLQGPVVTD